MTLQTVSLEEYKINIKLEVEFKRNLYEISFFEDVKFLIEVFIMTNSKLIYLMAKIIFYSEKKRNEGNTRNQIPNPKLGMKKYYHDKNE